jgi:DNA-binding transcriptional regulator YdaS (Cro superfamily)
MTDPTVTRAITAAGSAAKLATALGISRSAVSQWRTIPAWHIGKVAELTGIPAEELLPPQKSKPQSEEAA